jgi:ribosome-binding ATPase YchF (GTP1/OBG family)
MEQEEILQKLSNLDKKLDKILKLTTTIAKTLHIVPVSEKEEREIQLLQRKNAKVMQTIQDEIASLEEIPEKPSHSLNFAELFNASASEIYEDILGNDFN